jgi:hypothetical protein
MVHSTLPGHLITTKPRLILKELSEHRDSVHAVIRVVPASLRVDERLAQAVLALRPTLAQHACKQRGFSFFGDAIIGTTLPHLVEHVAIDLLVEGESHPRPRSGITTWLDREQGLMEVRLSCDSGGIGGIGDSAVGAVPPVGDVAASAATDAETTRRAIIRAVALVNSLFAC